LASSKLLERRWKQHDQDIHKERLRTVKSAVRSQFLGAAPYAHNEQVRTAAKEAVAERKYTEIERENRILLEKMSNIMQDPKPKLYNPKRFEVASLNRNKRKRELVKITIENQAILKRLQEKAPTYSVNKWNEEYKKNEQFKHNLLEYPQLLDMRSSQNMGTRLDGETDPAYEQLPNIRGSTSQGPRSSTASANMRNTRSGVYSAQTIGQQQKQPIVRQAENLDENRIVLYKRSKQLGQGYYIVEISSSKSHLFISAHDVESPESFLIELPEKRA